MHLFVLKQSVFNFIVFKTLCTLLMAQATKEELVEIENKERNKERNNANNNNNKYFGTKLSEEELKAQVAELNELMDPSSLTTIQQHCIAQIVACFIANHIHRYYHSHKYVATISNKLNNVNIILNDNDDDQNNDDQENKENNSELHLIYPIPILNSPPKILFDDSDNDNISNDNDDDNDDMGFTMSSIIKKPDYYCDITSTNIIWAKSFLQSFCQYLDVPKTQVINYYLSLFFYY